MILIIISICAAVDRSDKVPMAPPQGDAGLGQLSCGNARVDRSAQSADEAREFQLQQTSKSSPSSTVWLPGDTRRKCADSDNSALTVGHLRWVSRRYVWHYLTWHWHLRFVAAARSRHEGFPTRTLRQTQSWSNEEEKFDGKIPH
jgi:hypothetical protein